MSIDITLPGNSMLLVFYQMVLVDQFLDRWMLDVEEESCPFCKDRYNYDLK